MAERDSHLSTERALELVAILESLELDGPAAPTLRVVPAAEDTAAGEDATADGPAADA